MHVPLPGLPMQGVLAPGLAQELAFIRRRATRLAESPDGLEITEAADRALEDSRRAIEA